MTMHISRNVAMNRPHDHSFLLNQPHVPVMMAGNRQVLMVYPMR